MNSNCTTESSLISNFQFQPLNLIHLPNTLKEVPFCLLHYHSRLNNNSMRAHKVERGQRNSLVVHLNFWCSLFYNSNLTSQQARGSWVKFYRHIYTLDVSLSNDLLSQIVCSFEMSATAAGMLYFYFKFFHVQFISYQISCLKYHLIQNTSSSTEYQVYMYG